ncbi:hypothetical protein RI845_11390 [Thalassotalea nanhaiensis]|uniref:OmpR/PhoB-type domain-containing protein n=1 Tax=Thalassotalea nanhaiensis TaxID=3065648 RepID=A0ABY9TEA2_9GAMM|nr:hypothetical protein RI845_11390 [Colwelliaceae bacterium SQ345]
MIDIQYNEYKLENLIVNCTDMTISNNCQSIKFPVKVFDFFKLFLLDENQTVNRDLAIQILWNNNYPVGKRGYTNAMWYIRKVFDELGVDSNVYFKTLPKVGYKLEYIPEPIVENSTYPESQKSWPSGLVNNLLSIKLSNQVMNRKGLFLATLLSVIIIIITLSYRFVVKTNSTELNRPISPPVKITNLEGIEEHPSVSSDGRYLAFRWLKNKHNSQIYIKDLKDNQIPARLLTSEKESEFSPSWSPSGNSLAYLRISKEGRCQVRLHQLITNQDNPIASDCFYNSYSSALNWSPDGRYLLFSKKLSKGIALFKFDFEKKSIEQISFPKAEDRDVSAVFSADSKQVAFIRENISKASLMLLDKSGEVTVLLSNKLSITGLTWEYQKGNIYTNILNGGEYQTYSVNPTTKAEQVVQGISTSGNLTFNSQTSTLYYSKHVSQEYISQQSFTDSKEGRRISSSSRDLYGQYVNNTGDILFVSNRSNEWDLWLKTEQGSKNLTKGIGAAIMHRVSPTGKHFLVAIKHKANEDLKWYVGDLPDGQLTAIDLGTLTANSMNWSADGRSIYLAAETNGSSGIYKLTISDNSITQLTAGNEKFAIEGPDGHLYMSKEGEMGIWQFDQDSQKSQLFIKDLAINDFGNYFWQDENIYYVQRTTKYDQIKRRSMNGEQSIIATYPAGTVRIYFGIAPATKASFLLTLKSTIDADIYSISIN